MKPLPIRALGDQHEWLGYWWESSNPDVRIPGVLRHTPGVGSRLSLVGGFDFNAWADAENGGKVFSGYRDPDIIHGDINGTPMSLLDCRLAHSVQRLAFPAPAQEEQVIEASTCLEGVHVQDGASTSIAGYSVRVGGAELVFPSRHMFTFHKPPSEDRPRGEYHADVMPTRHDLEWEATTPVEDRITLERQWQQLSGGPADIHFTETATFRCEFGQAHTLTNVIRHANDLQLLVALLSDQTPAIEWLRCKTTDGSGVNLLFQMAEARESRMDGIVADYPLVRDLGTFADVVSAWFELLDKTGPACRILVNMRYNKNSYVEHQLATVMTAAERLHKGLSGSSARRPLRERLDQLCDQVPPGLLADILPDRQLWLRVVQTRNALTHTGESGDVGLTYAAVIVTEAVLLAVVLTQLQIREEEVIQSRVFSRRMRAARTQAEQYFSGHPAQAVGSGSDLQEEDHDD